MSSQHYAPILKSQSDRIRGCRGSVDNNPVEPKSSNELMNRMRYVEQMAKLIKRQFPDHNRYSR